VNNGGVFEVKGINNWGTIVGRYEPPDHFGAHGFKRWKNGTTHILDFPGALPGSTEPDGINDDGTVVGSYFTPDDSVHGFIFHNGQWATLDYPGTQAPGDTVLVGITNAGKIIGNAFSATDFSTTTFLYENGTFKVISVPNSVPGSASLRSISPKQGLILGVTNVATGSPAFIAQCQ
jgi:probable HAF family extracellular repeat protein